MEKYPVTQARSKVLLHFMKLKPGFDGAIIGQPTAAHLYAVTNRHRPLTSQSWNEAFPSPQSYGAGARCPPQALRSGGKPGALPAYVPPRQTQTAGALPAAKGLFGTTDRERLPGEPHAGGSAGSGPRGAPRCGTPRSSTCAAPNSPERRCGHFPLRRRPRTSGLRRRPDTPTAGSGGGKVRRPSAFSFGFSSPAERPGAEGVREAALGRAAPPPPPQRRRGRRRLRGSAQRPLPRPLPSASCSPLAPDITRAPARPPPPAPSPSGDSPRRGPEKPARPPPGPRANGGGGGAASARARSPHRRAGRDGRAQRQPQGTRCPPRLRLTAPLLGERLCRNFGSRHRTRRRPSDAGSPRSATLALKIIIKKTNPHHSAGSLPARQACDQWGRGKRATRPHRNWRWPRYTCPAAIELRLVAVTWRRRPAPRHGRT